MFCLQEQEFWREMKIGWKLLDFDASSIQYLPPDIFLCID